MPQLNWNDWKRGAIVALFERFQLKSFRFSQANGILNTPGDIQALSNEGYVRKIYRDGKGTVWQLTDDAVARAFKSAKKPGGGRCDSGMVT